MDPRHIFMDNRLYGFCVYCGGVPDTRDHVPSRVLLDEPYPSNLPVVSACKECNESFSLDELYSSCFLECVICGTTEPSELKRPKIQRLLEKNPKLRKQIEASKQQGLHGDLLWYPDQGCFHRLAEKLARGHIAYEQYPNLEEPAIVNIIPLPLLSNIERSGFENLDNPGMVLFPEVGSRAFFRALGKQPDRFEQPGGWIMVQEGRYRYVVVDNEKITVRIVISEYLGMEVIWN